MSSLLATQSQLIKMVHCETGAVPTFVPFLCIMFHRSSAGGAAGGGGVGDPGFQLVLLVLVLVRLLLRTKFTWSTSLTDKRCNEIK